MLWIKVLHIVFITSWFAMLFYLPRIFVNLAQAQASSKNNLNRQDLTRLEQERLLGMAVRLYRFGHILAVPALGFGLWLWWGYGIGMGQTWMHMKLFLVLLLLGYHHACGVLLKKFQAMRNIHTEKWYRWFNEVPVMVLLLVVILVVIKPFQ